ncbi:uncharacterized protein N7484_011766 [Penicillium longicatenatum]|uniref:uncharacterized protein n=1 Tax=Penicillium longicatenatum TaxID=1561947 RepID=UPI0025486ED0|nr:uncharacterized protein N7484_011766 [Penicillium longicatenatum]KAJ5631666.1 hypothetical protein N7484_011766 [Penicillium longicatenatum]
MSLSKTESDVILNRANVALARSQRLVASWLPAQTEEELANVKSEEELQREEDEIFTAVPETLGVGAPLPEKAADGSWNRTELSSNDKLRKQLLGKNYDRFMKAEAEKKAAAKASTAAAQAAKTAAAAANKQDEESDDDEEGRLASIGRNKRKAAPLKTKTKAVDGEDKGSQDEQDVPSAKEVPVRQAPLKGKKKATSYLDELLAERAKKRKKR